MLVSISIKGWWWKRFFKRYRFLKQNLIHLSNNLAKLHLKNKFICQKSYNKVSQFQY